MVTLLLVDTKPEINGIVHEVENMCHAVGMNVMIHHEGEDLGEVFGFVDSKIIAFSPEGRISLDEMAEEYGEDVLLVIGGFTEGDFRSDVYSRADDTVSLGPELLEIPKVIEKIIDTYEEKAKRRGK